MSSLLCSPPPAIPPLTLSSSLPACLPFPPRSHVMLETITQNTRKHDRRLEFPRPVCYPEALPSPSLPHPSLSPSPLLSPSSSLHSLTLPSLPYLLFVLHTPLTSLLPPLLLLSLSVPPYPLSPLLSPLYPHPGPSPYSSLSFTLPSLPHLPLTPSPSLSIFLSPQALLPSVSLPSLSSF